ncbi:MAG: AsmA family protein [Pseudomonadota bacterium]
MGKLLKWLGIGIGVLLVVIVAAALILPAVIDPNDHRERIAAEASAALKRDVALNGPMSWSVFPWIAIQLSDVTVANEAGFEADHLLSVGEAAVRVRLLPLFTGSVEIGDVILRQPQVNLEIDQRGRSNWESLVSGSADASETSSRESGTEAISIAGVEIEQAQLTYRDRSSDLLASVTDFNLATGAIDPDQPLDLDLSMNVEVDGTLAARIESAFEGRGLLTADPMQLAVARLDVDGALEGDLPFRLTLSEPLSYDEGNDQLSARGLTLSSGAARVLVSVEGQAVSTDEPALTGTLEVPEFDLRAWMAEALGSAFQSDDAEALSRFSARLGFSGSTNRAALDELSINLDDTKISGEAKLADIGLLKGTFSVLVDDIDVDRYLPSGTDEAPPPDEASEPVNLADLDLGQLNGEITVSRLKVAGVTAEDVKLRLRSDAAGLTLEPMTAALYQGALNSQVKLSTGGQGQLTLNQSLSDVSAGPLLTDFLGTQYMTGTGGLETNLVLDNPLGANPLAGANGTISFEFRDGAIFGLDVFGALNQALALLDRGTGESTTQNEEGQTTFSNMVLEAAVVDGVLRTQTLALTSPILEVTGDLTINLADMSVDGLLEPVLLDATGRGAMEKIAGKKIPISLSGNLAAPGVSIDAARLLLASQQDKIDEKKDELIGRLLGDDDEEAGESEDDDEDAGKALLRSLLRGSEADNEDDPG